MNAFFIGLQFLTRIKLVQQNSWPVESFGKSITYFPLVGMVIGALLSGAYYILTPVFSPFALATLLVFLEFMITGGLHADGLMDTCDGYFSGREKERCLEIMKDSRVGSNAVVAFVFLVLLKVAFLSALHDFIYLCLFSMPVISRWVMTYTIKQFPYARPQGIGKAFAEFSPKYSHIYATILMLVPVVWFGWIYLILAAISWIWMHFANRAFVRKLGGVTGDTYGAVTETTELIILFVLVCLESGVTWSM